MYSMCVCKVPLNEERRKRITTKLDQALLLRKEEKLKKSNELLLKLVQELLSDAYVNYQCPWGFDVLEEGSNAVPYYLSAKGKRSGRI